VTVWRTVWGHRKRPGTDVADYYELLGVARDAGGDEIKRAFRKLARETHPDANPDDPTAEARFKEIAKAYEVLSDPERRARYDRGGDPFAGMGGAGGFSSLDDLLRSVFGEGGLFGEGLFGTSARPRQRRGRDVRVSVDVELEDAAFGTTRELSFRAGLACETCSGTGAATGTHPTRCERCGGAGQVRVARRSIIGNVMSVETCNVCRGAGDVVEKPCETCHGRGAVEGTQSVSVDIPAGVQEGTRLRLNGYGEYGGRGAPAGDLYVDISIKPHDAFTRDGDDLIHELTVGIAQASLGADVSVPLIEGGQEELEVTPGTQPGTVLRLAGKGTGRLGRRGRGDMYVRVNVAVPDDLSDDARDALRAYAEATGEETVPPKRGWRRR